MLCLLSRSTPGWLVLLLVLVLTNLTTFARKLYHTLGSIENYITTFARVVVLVNKSYADDEIAFVMRRSTPLIAAYRKLYGEFQDKHTGRRRIQEILSRVENPSAPSKKRGR